MDDEPVRVRVARAALMEGGFPHLAERVHGNKQGDPSVRLTWRATPAESVAIHRAFVLAHAADPDGAVIMCCEDSRHDEALVAGARIIAPAGCSDCVLRCLHPDR